MGSKKFNPEDMMAQMMCVMPDVVEEAEGNADMPQQAPEPESPAPLQMSQPKNTPEPEKRRRGRIPLSEKKETLTVQVNSELLGKLRYLKEQKGLSMTDLISTSVKLFITTYEKKIGQTLKVVGPGKQSNLTAEDLLS